MILYVPRQGSTLTLFSDESLSELLRFLSRRGVRRQDVQVRELLGAFPSATLSGQAVDRVGARDVLAGLKRTSWQAIWGTSLEVWSRRWMANHVIRYPRKAAR